MDVTLIVNQTGSIKFLSPDTDLLILTGDNIDEEKKT